MLVGGDNSGTLSVARTATSSDVSYASIPPSVKLDNYRHVRLGLAEPTDDVTNRKWPDNDQTFLLIARRPILTIKANKQNITNNTASNPTKFCTTLKTSKCSSWVV